ncbi:AlpA family phage regulatory protein [Chelativorans sp. SCAU2101]|uniref:AlpA family phage regulatory protein n=1 Tax=Chelativorans petroleitrophicus TaxID=2975484 RepID=A0A9X2X609_9HYPH|nr:AlpA family phage regulatory protein [Chelativorans petroleitrophicus]
MAERFISIREVTDRVSLCRTEIYDRMRAGKFPQSVALGPQKVVWVESEIDAWMQARIENAEDGIDWRRWRARKAVNSRGDRKVAA